MALRAVEGLGDLTLCRLARSFGSPEAVFAATIGELVTNGGLTAPQAQAVLRGPNREVRRDIERELKAFERLRLSVVT
jgi:hypothetical protein